MNVKIMALKDARARFRYNDYTDYRPPPAFYCWPTMYIISLNENETINAVIHEVLHEVFHDLLYNGLFDCLEGGDLQDKFDSLWPKIVAML